MTSPSNPYAELVETLIQRTKDYEAEISRLTRDVEELVEALQELAEAVANDANGEHGISGFLGARLTDARDALAHITLTRLSGEEK